MPELQLEPDVREKYYYKHEGLKDIILETLEKYIYENRYTAGLEFLGKDGQEVKQHLHIHFQSLVKRDTIAKQIVRVLMEDTGDTRKKSHAYYLKAESEINVDKFYQYPLKENLLTDTDKYNWTSGFTKEEVAELNIKAHAIRQVSYEVNQNKTSKREDISFIEKLFFYIQADGNDPKNHKEVFLRIYDFYIEQDKPLDKRLMSNQAYLYLGKKKIITGEEFYNLNI